jgi:fluoride exporter
VAKLLWIGSGGAVGALLRYAMVMGVHRVFGSAFPWGTLTVNVVGSLLIGVLWAMAEKVSFTAAASAFLFIGVLGAFTTFSTYALESANLFRDGKQLAALVNMLLSNATCIVAVVAGLKIGQYFWAG